MFWVRKEDKDYRVRAAREGSSEVVLMYKQKLMKWRKCYKITAQRGESGYLLGPGWKASCGRIRRVEKGSLGDQEPLGCSQTSRIVLI